MSQLRKLRRQLGPSKKPRRKASSYLPKMPEFKEFTQRDLDRVLSITRSDPRLIDLETERYQLERLREALREARPHVLTIEDHAPPPASFEDDVRRAVEALNRTGFK
jgi:hypothetical protein